MVQRFGGAAAAAGIGGGRMAAAPPPPPRPALAWSAFGVRGRVVASLCLALLLAAGLLLLWVPPVDLFSIPNSSSTSTAKGSDLVALTTRSSNSKTQPQPQPARNTTTATCPKSIIFPFRVGCPNRCQRATSAGEAMYRVALPWYFGRPDLPPDTAYDRGVNYRCPVELVDNFRRAEQSVTDWAATTTTTTTPQMVVEPQRHIHLSLSYLCCLRQNETDWAGEVMYQWVQ